MPPTIYEEKHSRALVKGITWRAIATCDTIILAYLFTGSIDNALKIGLAEVITKITLFYFHERVWKKVSLGRKTVAGVVTDRQWRSIVKGITWRFFGTLDTICWSFIITGSVQSAFKIGATELITKVLFFWLHERVWLRVQWGKSPIAIHHSPASQPSIHPNKVVA